MNDCVNYINLQERAARGPVSNTGFNLNSTRLPLTWWPSHIEKLGYFSEKRRISGVRTRDACMTGVVVRQLTNVGGLSFYMGSLGLDPIEKQLMGVLRHPAPGSSRATRWQSTWWTVRGFVKWKKFKKSDKNSEWVGGSSPNSDFLFFLKILCFLCCFLLFYMFPKKKTW